MGSHSERVIGLWMLAGVAGLWGCAGAPRQAAAPSEATEAAHVQAATQAAGSDLGEVLSLCKAAPATRAGQEDLDNGLRALINKPAPPSGKAFDNLYFVGADWSRPGPSIRPRALFLLTRSTPRWKLRR